MAIPNDFSRIQSNLEQEYKVNKKLEQLENNNYSKMQKEIQDLMKYKAELEFLLEKQKPTLRDGFYF